MNKRELSVLFVLWLPFPIAFVVLPWTFIGCVGLAFTFMVPIFTVIAHFEPVIQKWTRNGDKK